MGIFDSVLKTVQKVVSGGKDEPVEGIAFEDWVKVNAKLAAGTPTEEIVKLLGIDRPKWDRVNNEWLARMQNDRTFTFSIRYAAIFNSVAKGNLPLKKEFNEQTFPIEKYAELLAATEFLGKQGRDAQDILKDFGLTVVDYSNIGSYWGKKIVMSPLGLGVKFQNILMEYRAKYEKQIKEDGTHDDIAF